MKTQRPNRLATSITISAWPRVFMGTAVILLYLAGVRPQVGLAAISPTRTLPFIWAVLFLIAAFGIKAGMFPLHIWLPKAHPVAPTPPVHSSRGS